MLKAGADGGRREEEEGKDAPAVLGKAEEGGKEEEEGVLDTDVEGASCCRLSSRLKVAVAAASASASTVSSSW